MVCVPGAQRSEVGNNKGNHHCDYCCFFQPGVAVAAGSVYHVFFCFHPECLRLFGFVSGVRVRPGYLLQKVAVLTRCLLFIRRLVLVWSNKSLCHFCRRIYKQSVCRRPAR